MTRLMWSFFFSSTLLALLLCAAFPGLAQTTTMGTITGLVTDPSNAVVPDATVTIQDTATKAVRTITTNSAGRYVFVDVPPGTYDITISKAGFEKVVVANDAVKIGEVSTHNVALKVGVESQTVEVQSSGTELQTLNATVGNQVSGLALESLPTIARDTSTFLTLQSGISPDGSVSGAASDQSSFQLDGGENTNDMDGNMSVYTPSYAGDPTGGVAGQSFGSTGNGNPTGVMPTPADSVEEFKVNVAGMGADFNSSAGAQVQIVTKRGTDQWHSTGYEYYLDNNFNANTWQNNFSGIPIPSYHYNRFGGAIGGPIIPKKILGGKTYFFANYEGFRFPQSTTIEKGVPSAEMRLGLLQFPDANGAVQTYNLNPVPVTVNGVTYSPAQCPAGPCDPRGIGINPLVQQLWNKYVPASNESGCGQPLCDGLNILGFTANMATPQSSNFAVARIDHDFGDKWHFMSSYRYYNLTSANNQQVDIGGFFPGDTRGVPKSLSNNPQQPWFLVAGVTANLSNNWTNDIRYSYLRNWWAWGRGGAPVQFPGLGGALEPGGENNSPNQGSLEPYNVNTAQTRTRFWDGQDNMVRDDATWLHGKHMIQFGGMYQHNFNWHERTDNGGGINYYPVYQLGTASNSGIDMTGYMPGAVPSSNAATWGRDYAAMLGLVSASQVAYTRSGKNLTLNPPLTPAVDKVSIPFYNFYGSDTWRMTPKVTLTFGLGWTLEMPPTEATGKQVIFVGPDNDPVNTEQYLHARETAALQGQVFNPEVGFSLIGNTAHPSKYPYNPFYGEWSPRIAAAWDIFGDGTTVLRGGYGRTYGRLNGVDLVLVPLLGTGLIQPVQCTNALANGICGVTGTANPVTTFRVGVDGLVAPLPAASPTLPQPYYPGVNGIAAGGSLAALDPNFRPNNVDTFTFTFARQLNNKMSIEIGYIGRLIHNEYAPINLNAVPYMMTMGGQTFAKAYANTVIGYCGGGNVNTLGGGNCIGNAAAVGPQPFFEAALTGTGYCNGFANCTQAVIAKEGLKGTGNLAIANVWSLYSDLDSGGFNFPRSMMNTPINCPTGAEIGCQGQLTSGVGMNASVGYGNYSALFISLKSQDWHGLTMQSNFTWSKALGTGAEVQATGADTPPDPFNLRTGYGYQAFDRRYVYNLFFVYQPNFYKSQSGFLGHVLGGWTIAPVFTAGSGLPITLGTINGGGQAFGEGDSINFFGYGNSENAIPLTPANLGQGSRYFVSGNGTGTAGLNGANMFANPAAALNNIRQPILGYDSRDGGFGVYRGLPYWNVDLSVKKMFKITERFSTEFQVVFTNVFNHDQFGDPTGDFLNTASASSFGTLPGSVTNFAGQSFQRQIQFGLRLSF
jgi:Carboxypeptidase regulatory-like domain